MSKVTAEIRIEIEVSEEELREFGSNSMAFVRDSPDEICQIIRSDDYEIIQTDVEW